MQCKESASGDKCVVSTNAWASLYSDECGVPPVHGNPNAACAAWVLSDILPLLPPIVHTTLYLHLLSWLPHYAPPQSPGGLLNHHPLGPSPSQGGLMITTIPKSSWKEVITNWQSQKNQLSLPTTDQTPLVPALCHWQLEVHASHFHNCLGRSVFIALTLLTLQFYKKAQKMWGFPMSDKAHSGQQVMTHR